MFEHQTEIIDVEIDATAFLIILLSITRYYCEDSKPNGVEIEEIQEGGMRGGLGTKFIKQFFSFLLMLASLMIPVSGVMSQTREEYRAYIKELHSISSALLHNQIAPGRCLTNALMVSGLITNLDDYRKLSLQTYAIGINGDSSLHPTVAMEETLKVNFVTETFSSSTNLQGWKNNLSKIIDKHKDTLIAPGYITTFLLSFPTNQRKSHAVGLSVYRKSARDGDYVYTIIDSQERMSRGSPVFSSEKFDAWLGGESDFDKYITRMVYFAPARDSLIRFTKIKNVPFDFRSNERALKVIEDGIFEKVMVFSDSVSNLSGPHGESYTKFANAAIKTRNYLYNTYPDFKHMFEIDY